jgi:choline dehydrogenase-like flavoprotein
MEGTDMNGRKYEYVIVGSGAGGATLARELSKRGKQVLVVERGKLEDSIGTIRDTMRFYDMNKSKTGFATSREGVMLLRTFMAGGTTVVAMGNAVRCLEEELAGFGINLEEEFAEAEREMDVAPIAEGLLSEGAQKIRWAAHELGYRMDPMPKVIDPVRCQKCGGCLKGCVHQAKWTALDYLEEARQNGADVVYNTRIQEATVDGGKARGVRGTGPSGPVEFPADVVVLAAGGLGTPVILLRSGVKEAGQNLFIDMLVNTYGVAPGLNHLHEPNMALVNLEFQKTRGFLLSPFANASRITRFLELGAKGPFLLADRLIGIMTKTADDTIGRVYEDGSVSKPVTEGDRTRLLEGSSISKEILIKAGAKADSILVGKPLGAHPGGTAAIGQIVDKDLQTHIENLFVCDCSVFPTSPGLPPFLTIVALAKRLGKTLAA